MLNAATKLPDLRMYLRAKNKRKSNVLFRNDQGSRAIESIDSKNFVIFLDSCAPAWSARLPIIEKAHFQLNYFQVFCQVSRLFDPITPLR